MLCVGFACGVQLRVVVSARQTRTNSDRLQNASLSTQQPAPPPPPGGGGRAPPPPPPPPRARARARALNTLPHLTSAAMRWSGLSTRPPACSW